VTRLLTNDEIAAHFSVTDTIDAMETMFTEMGAERATSGSREDILTPVHAPPAEATSPTYHGLKTMAGSIPALGVGAVRINSDIIHWPERDGSPVREKIPAADGRYTGLVLLFSTDTGEPLAIFPDGIVQSYRVGSTSVLGARTLAVEDPAVMGLLGAGWQAEAHLRCHDAVFDLERVRVFSPTPSSRREFVDEMADEVGPAVTAVDTPRRVFQGADVVQCATSALSPVFEADWVETGTHVGVIRSFELPPDLFDPAAVDAFVQSWSAVTRREEVGERLVDRPVPTKDVLNYVVEGDDPVPKFADLDRGEATVDWDEVPGLAAVLVGAADGRRHSSDVTVFYNRGMGIQFAAVGHALYDIAAAEDLGQELPTELFTQVYRP
jgi:ornithine cyclodeaminase/alanine dehydrogenase-like protein (mu-crystallin family)